MTQGFVGADTQQLDTLAERFDNAGESLEGIRSTVGASLGRFYWEGRDAEQFRDEWRSKHAATIVAVCGALRETAKALRINAAQQRGASEAGGTALDGPSSAPPAPVTTPPAGVSGNRGWQEVQQAYDAWASGTRFAHEDYRYQCTSYANFRWHELGYEGNPIAGHGSQMAQNAGQVSAQPSLHAMASYGRSGEYGHVMIVEEVRADGTVRFSEMNVGANPLEGNPDEYRDKRTISPSADGKYYVGGQEIRFAAFRK